MRIQPGMHGPVTILPDDHDERAALDDLELEFYTNEESGHTVVNVRRGGQHINAMLLK